MTVPYLTSELLSAVPGIRHGFFTRNGGVSSGLYESLNIGRGSNDGAASVEANRHRIQLALGADTLTTVYQIHSAKVVDASEANEKADGIITAQTGTAIGILTADCVPVLLASKDGAKVAAVHAGWKGATAGIIATAIKQFGNAKVVAAIGPAIAQKSYEVGQDVFDAAGAPTFFAPNGTPGKYQFNLQGLVAEKLKLAGVSDIDLLAEDTYSQEKRFFSFRRSTHRAERDYGRQLSAILRIR